jgi:uncharacterized membrane-anchored protein YitT (DUF2179 family)
MNPFWQSIIIQIVTGFKRKDSEKLFSRYRIAKMYREWRITWKSRFKSVILITIGIFLAAFGFKGFLLTNDFIDGGSTGISLLLSATTKLPLQYFLVIVNIPFIVLAYKVMGRTFAIKTAFAIAGLIMCLTFIKFPNVTNDNLLVAVFGGFFLGAGIGFAIRGGAVIDGSEVLAIFLSRKFGMTIGDVIAVINVMIFLAAAYFLSVEKALYSMITYLAASKTLDFIVEGIEEYIGVTIVAVHSEEMRQMIIKKLGRGVTVYKGKRGYGDIEFAKDVNVIYTVITRLEIAKLNTEIEKIEPDAFVVMHSVKDTRGGIIKRLTLDH